MRTNGHVATSPDDPALEPFAVDEAAAVDPFGLVRGRAALRLPARPRRGAVPGRGPRDPRRRRRRGDGPRRASRWLRSTRTSSRPGRRHRRRSDSRASWRSRSSTTRPRPATEVLARVHGASRRRDDAWRGRGGPAATAPRRASRSPAPRTIERRCAWTGGDSSCRRASDPLSLRSRAHPPADGPPPRRRRYAPAGRAVTALAGRGRPPRPPPSQLVGLRVRNRIGVGAGFDKDGVALGGWAALGLGFAEVGTVTPGPQPGLPVRASSGCPMTTRSSTAWASTTTALRRSRVA